MPRFARPLAVIAALSTPLAHADVITIGNVSPDPTTILPTQTLSIGLAATGELLIDNTTDGNGLTSVTSLNGTLFDQSSVTVKGAGATWDTLSTSLSSLNVGLVLLFGVPNTSSLDIENGGAVNSNGGINLGHSLPSISIVTVTGTNSKLTSANQLFVGSAGSATLNIENGGAVTSNSDTILGVSRGSTGIVTVTGTNSKLTTANQLVVGSDGSGTLNIENGRTVNSAIGQIGQIGQTDLTNPSTVTVTNSTWTNTDSLYVGGSDTAQATFANSGILNINTGANVSVVNTLKIWSPGTVNLNGGTHPTADLIDLSAGGILNLNTGTFTNAQLLNTTGGTFNFNAGTLQFNSSLTLDATTIAMFGATPEITSVHTLEVTGTSTIIAGERLALNGGTLSTGSLNILGTFDFDQGTLNLTNSSLTIGAAGLLGSTLVLQPGMAVNVTNATGNVDAGGQLLINGSTASFSAAGGTNNGQISVINGSLTYTDAMTNNTSGELTLVNATATFAGDGIPTSGGGNNADGLTNLGTLNLINATVNGDVHSPAGSTINVAGTVTFNNGLVSGGANFSGTSNLITFNGTYSPGDSPSDVQITGDVSLGTAATLILELAGTTLGTEYDHLNITGNLAADGTLDIQLLNNFAPTFGDTFDLLDFGSLTGTFDAINLPSLAGGLSFDTSSLLTTGSISVVPEPTTAMLVTFLGLIVTRRRQLNRDTRL